MRSRRKGISVFAVLFPAVAFTGLVEVLRHSPGTTGAVDRGVRVLDAAEAEIDAHDRRLRTDPLHAVKNCEAFAVDPVAMEYVARAAGAARLRLRYSNGGKPILFADRATPSEPWDSIEVTAAFFEDGRPSGAVARYRMEMAPAALGALVCTAGEITLSEDERTHVFGSVRARVETDLPELRFNCDRFEAASRAGGGEVFDDLASFALACNRANAANKALEGVIVVRIHPTRDGAHPRLVAGPTAHGEHRIERGIRVRGTLLFRFPNNTQGSSRLVIDTPLNVNAADLTSWRPADETTYLSGYPPAFADLGRAAWSHSIAPKFETITPADGLPAVMVDNGSLTIRSMANVCGVVFASSSIRVTNTRGETQFLHGALVARDRVDIQNGPAGRIAIRFDPEALTNLQTLDCSAKRLTRIGFAVLATKLP